MWERVEREEFVSINYLIILRLELEWVNWKENRIEA